MAQMTGFTAELAQRLAWDKAFVKMHMDGIPDGTKQALDEFWRDEKFRPFREVCDLPHDDLDEFIICLMKLASGERRLDDPEIWEEVGTVAADRLSQRDRVAACFPGLYALAGLEGADARGMIQYQWAAAFPSWFMYALIAARALFDAGCIHAARYVAERGRELVSFEYRSQWHWSLVRGGDFTHIIDGLEELLGLIQVRVDNSVADLAWDLREASTPDTPNFRAELSALCWLLGDVPQAELLSADGDPLYRPSFRYLREIVSTSLRRIPVDPVLQRVWLRMKDRPPIDIRSHATLFNVINTRYSNTLFGLLESRSGDGGSPWSTVLSDALVRYARREPANEQLKELQDIYRMLQPFASMDPGCALAFMRTAWLTCLGSDTDTKERARLWRQNAHLSSSVLEGLVRRGDLLDFGRSLSVPMFYLVSEVRGDPGDHLDDLERHKASGLVYSRAICPPLLAQGGATSDAILGTEEELTQELREARLQWRAPDLPLRYVGVLSEGRGDPDTQLGRELASQRVDQAWRSSGRTWTTSIQCTAGREDEAPRPSGALRNLSGPRTDCRRNRQCRCRGLPPQGAPRHVRPGNGGGVALGISHAPSWCDTAGRHLRRNRRLDPRAPDIVRARPAAITA